MSVTVYDIDTVKTMLQGLRAGHRDLRGLL